MIEKLEDRSKRLRENLVRDLTEKFANASGYQARVDGVNLWAILVVALLDGVEDMIEESKRGEE